MTGTKPFGAILRRGSLLGLVAVIAASAPLYAQSGPGALDPNFGSGGKVLADSGRSDFGRSLAIDSAGRLLVAGNAVDSNGWDVAVWRYNPDGTPDLTFGAAEHPGLVVTDLGRDEFAVAIAEDAQGRLVVVANSFVGNGEERRIAIARYQANGDLDTTFGGLGTGARFVGFGLGGEHQPAGVAITPTGHILVGGSSTANGGNWDFALKRLNSDGLDDTSFPERFIHFVGDDHARTMAVDPQGRIVMAGLRIGGGLVTSIALTRLNPDGSIDAGFGTDGRTTAGLAEFNGVTIDGLGRIVAVGRTTATPNEMAVYRFLDDGSLDQLFGSGGKVTLSISSSDTRFDVAHGVAIDGAGRIVVAGQANDNVLQSTLVVARLRDDGTLDSAFQGSTSPAGLALVDMDGIAGGDNAAWAVIMDRDGRIVTAGYASNTATGGLDLALAGFISDPSADLSVTVSGAPTIVPGDTAFFSVIARNHGPNPAAGVQIVSTFPAGLTPVSCTTRNAVGPVGTCTITGNTVVGSVSLVGSALVWTDIEATVGSGVSDGAVLSVTGTASAASPADPNPANNTFTLGVVVRNRADLLVSQSVSKLKGRQLAFDLAVENVGPYEAREVVLINPIPEGTTFVSHTEGPWTCTAPPPGSVGTMICTTPALLPGERLTLTLQVQVTAAGNVKIPNTVTVTAATFDPKLANNTATRVTKVNGR